MGDRRGSYRVLEGRSEGKRPLERQRILWEGNIKMGLQEVERGGVEWIFVAQDKKRR
jgi:hypothetical protein